MWTGEHREKEQMVNVAVHTITLNEAEHLPRWAESADDADLLMIADTGSTDATLDVAHELDIEVANIWVSPWRFDLARNAGLALLPASIDVVITLDADEVLVPGWRAKLEESLTDWPDARRWSYDYVWSWVEGQEGRVPDVQFRADRCFSREGWQWHGAVHEVLQPSSAETARVASPVWAGFRIEHFADASKSRGSYLKLLELAVKEEPHNPRQRFYLAREYLFVGQWPAARTTFMEFLAMPEARWPAERAEAYRYLAKMDDDPERWLWKAVAEDPGRRDAVVDLVDLYVTQERWEEAGGMAARALRVRTRPGDYMSRARVWDDVRLREVIDRSRVFD
jgi:glycosyltransferase involved in cell wall biosynthesis